MLNPIYEGIFQSLIGITHKLIDYLPLIYWKIIQVSDFP